MPQVDPKRARAPQPFIVCLFTSSWDLLVEQTALGWSLPTRPLEHGRSILEELSQCALELSVTVKSTKLLRPVEDIEFNQRGTVRWHHIYLPVIARADIGVTRSPQTTLKWVAINSLRAESAGDQTWRARALSQIALDEMEE